MSFLTTLALGVGLLVVVPYLAHRLRRRRAEERPFPPARLVAPAPPHARRRARLEDPALFATRALAVLALAVLGATPLVRCSRLSLQRTGGASVAMALVVDDSMSMRAESGGHTRFERAKRGALELLGSAREGDAIAVVLAGQPARVALAATTDLAAARAAVEAIAQSDRATDAEGALSLAQTLLGALPQLDRRVVVLSDLADGRSEGPPLDAHGGAPIWLALPDLRGDLPDCAILRADQRGARVRVTVACGPRRSASGREVIVEDAQGKAMARATVRGDPSGADAPTSEVTVVLGAGDARPAQARLSGGDAVASDDVAPVIPEAGRGTIATVADSTSEAVATGGAPIVEQALAALKLDVDIRPIPAVPDRGEDIAGDIGILLDDPPGLTPEQRHTLGAFVRAGGVALLALGPHAAAAPLGASFEPLLDHSVGWEPVAVHGAAAGSAVGAFAESASSLVDLDVRRRATLATEDARTFDPLVSWEDGPPLVARKTVGRGEVWLVTLPFSVDESDLPLRPAFLTLLDQWMTAARDHAVPMRTEVGTPWKFGDARQVDIAGPGGKLATVRSDGVTRATPWLTGLYRLTVDGKAEARVVSPIARELDFRPRGVVPSAADSALGERHAALDASGPVAIALLALMFAELALRMAMRSRSDRERPPPNESKEAISVS